MILKTYRNNKGLTLIELMIVIMVIGILGSIGLPTYSKFQSRAHNTSALNDAIHIKMEAASYHAEWGHYPY